MRALSRAAMVFAAMVMSASALHAQTSFSAAAGLAMPIGSTADAVKMGYNATLGLGIKPPLAPIGLRIEGMWNQFDSKGGSKIGTRILAGTANITLSGAGMPIPMGYLIGGLGMYNLGVTNWPALAGPKPDAESKVGFNIGVGLNFPLTGFSTYAEARLHIVNTSGSSTKFTPIVFGIKF